MKPKKQKLPRDVEARLTVVRRADGLAARFERPALDRAWSTGSGDAGVYLHAVYAMLVAITAELGTLASAARPARPGAPDPLAAYASFEAAVRKFYVAYGGSLDGCYVADENGPGPSAH